MGEYYWADVSSVNSAALRFFFTCTNFYNVYLCQVHSLSSHTLLAIPSIEIVKDPILGPFWTPVEQPCIIIPKTVDDSKFSPLCSAGQCDPDIKKASHKMLAPLT